MDSPILVFVLALLAIFIIFKIFSWSLKIFFKILINALVGAFFLFVFNYVFAGVFNLSFFSLEINWITALVTGILGVPGVAALLLIKFMQMH